MARARMAVAIRLRGATPRPRARESTTSAIVAAWKQAPAAANGTIDWTMSLNAWVTQGPPSSSSIQTTNTTTTTDEATKARRKPRCVPDPLVARPAGAAVAVCIPPLSFLTVAPRRWTRAGQFQNSAQGMQGEDIRYTSRARRSRHLGRNHETVGGSAPYPHARALPTWDRQTLQRRDMADQDACVRFRHQCPRNWGAQSWVKRGNMERRAPRGVAYVPAATAAATLDRPPPSEGRGDRVAGGGAVGGGRAELPAGRRRGRAGAARRGRPAERCRVGSAPPRGLAARPGGRGRRGAGPGGGQAGRRRRRCHRGRRGGAGRWRPDDPRPRPARLP